MMPTLADAHLVELLAHDLDGVSIVVMLISLLESVRRAE